MLLVDSVESMMMHGIANPKQTVLSKYFCYLYSTM